MAGQDGVEGRTAAQARARGNPAVVPAPMPAVPPPTGLVDQARAAAERAALDAGVEVGELRRLGQLREMIELFGEVWGADPDSMLPLATARALQHAGNYAAGAVDRAGGPLVGAVVGMFGLRAGRLILHSHIAGVRPRAQGRAVGFALKQHQRAWALAAGVGTVEWTFDPLVRRNTFFNVTKLGVRVVAYHPDFYGPMADALNAGEPTDRCVARWDLASPAATAAAGGAAAEPDRAALLAGGATVVLDQAPGGGPLARPPTAGTLLAWVPADVVALRARAPELAHSWRLALRATLEGALGGGHALTGATRDGWYVLTEEEDVRSRS